MKLLAILALSLILTGGAAAQQARTSSIPTELLGKWSAGAISSARVAESGEKTSLELNADGTFVFATRLSLAIDGCETSVFNYNPGRYTVTGNLVNFDPTDDRLTYAAACHPNLRGDRHSPPVKASFAYAVKVVDGIETLCLSNGRELEKCYSRAGKS